MYRHSDIISESFREKILHAFRKEGEDWLVKLPGLLEEFTVKWELTDCMPEENLSYHYICYANSPKYGAVVLKAGVPHLELFTGIDALTYYGGKNSCRLFEKDKEKGVMLLERIFPGTTLRKEKDFEQRIKAGTELVSKLTVQINGSHDFPIYRSQLEKAFKRARDDARAGEEFLSMLDVAENLYREIESLGRPKMLLNGDIRHENILKDSDGNWKVIDPQGRIGEKCLEAGRFLLNEWEWFGGIGDLKHMACCIDYFSEALKESRRTIAISCFLDYALVSCWSLEEGKEPEELKDSILQMKCLLELIG